MNDVAETKKSKDRSPNFPFITLERALERAREFYAEERRGVAPFTRAVKHWRYTETSSGGLQTVAALKSYGLMVESGGTGTARQLQLTELALRILLDQRPDSLERLDFIRQAARAPAIAAAVYAQWPDGLPNDGTLHHFLVFDKRFNEETVPGVTKILKENQRLAQLQDDPVLSVPMETSQELVMEAADRPAVGTRGDAAAPLKALQPGAATPGGSVALAGMSFGFSAEPKGSGHTEQLASIDGENTVALQFNSKPDADFYEWIAFYASKKAEKMRATAKPLLPPPAAQSTDNLGDGNEAS